MEMIGITLSTLLLIASCAQCANILFVIPSPIMSHYIFSRPIGLELAKRGHNVTVITTHIEKNPPPNYNQVKVGDKKILNLLGGKTPNIFTMVDWSAEEFYNKVQCPSGAIATELTLNSSEVQEFIKKDNTFDLVICVQLFQEALYAFSVKYNAPLAIVSPIGNSMRHNFITGNPLQLATVVFEYLKLYNPESFWGRLRNVYITVYDMFWWRYWYMYQQEALVNKYFPELLGKVPSLYEVQKEASLMLINSHFSYDTPSALLPNIIEIGGAHLSKSNTSLPEDLQMLLDESKNGVVYMSFGSNVKSAELPEQKKKAFINVFKQLKQTVLWKWEEDELEGKPKNLVTRRWLPQKDVLAHPNIKVFISHGGLIGTQEALFNGVPIIGVPIFSDQYNNLLLAEQAGVGKILQYHDINEVTLYKTLKEVLDNESYMKNAKEMQKRWNDRPMSPLDTAMFWLEYVIRNNGSEYMKNPARNISWLAYNMMDVYAFLLAIFTGVIFIFVKLIGIISVLSSPRHIVTESKKRL